MDAGQIIALGFLAILTISFVGSLLSNTTHLRNAVMWVLIGVGGIAAAGLWGDISRDFTPRQSAVFDGARIEVPQGLNGHYSLTLKVNGVDVDFLVDTGATQVVLTREDAARVGLDPEKLAFINTAFTANGEVRTAPVRLDTMELGDIRDTRVRASVTEGEMNGSLLGMTYLSRFESIEIRRGLLVLTR